MRSILTLSLAATALAGCAGEHCFRDGHCIPVPSDAGWYGRWLAAGLLIAVVLFAFAGMISALQSSDDGGVFLAIVIMAVAGGGAIATSPGCTRPHVAAERAIAEYEKKLANREGEAEAARRATPEHQLQVARAARAKLDAHLRVKVAPLKKKYASELEGYVAKLRVELPRAKVKSHAELVARAEELTDAADLLLRAAILERSIAWLERKALDGGTTLRALDQTTWLLARVVELHEVAAADDRVEVAGIVAAADAIVEERLDPPARREIAEYEARLFGRLIGGAP